MDWRGIEWVLRLYWLSMIMVPTFAFIMLYLRVKRGVVEKPKAIRYFAGIAIIPIILYGLFFLLLVSLEEVAQIDIVSEELARSLFVVMGIGFIIWLLSLIIFGVTLAFFRKPV